ncbi:MAG: hypothetical protein ACK5RO_10945 [Pseudobdellovibrionaceae bacterium]|jgi:pilus assembly protein CpaC
MVLLALYLSMILKAETLVLGLGEQKTVSSSGPIWVENGKVLQVKVSGSKMILRGKNPGETVLKSGNSRYKVKVTDISDEVAQDSIESAIRKTLGLRAQMTDGVWQVQGELSAFFEWKAISQSCLLKKCRYLFRAKIPEVLQESVRTGLAREMKGHFLPPEKIHFSPWPRLYLNPKHPQFQLFEKWAHAFGVEIQEDSTALTTLPTTRIHIYILEVQRSWLQSFGISLPAQLSFQSFPQLKGSHEEIFSQLKALETQGVVKTLAQPQILSKSGKESEFFAGGEIPVPIITPRSREVLWKKYGIQIKFLPLADRSGRLNLSLDAEVSSVKSSGGSQEIPEISSHRISTHFDLMNPEPITLSGLIRNETLSSESGLPWFSQLPLFKELMNSQEYRENRTELMIVVQPEIL